MTEETTPAKVRLTDGLGPLPEPFAVHELWGQNVNVYTAEQMRTYALLERERCARVCADEAALRTRCAGMHEPESASKDRLLAGARAAINCEKGIRSGEEI